MQLGHVIYKARGLPRAVVDFGTRGFVIKCGTVKRPYNALIYFSSDPYLELLVRTGMPPLLGCLPTLGLHKGVVRRFLFWSRGPEGMCGLCLEGDVSELEEGRTLLGDRGLRLKPKHVGPHGRELCYEVFFPDDIDPSFFMNHFNTDPKSRDFTHPNGIGSIAHITYPMPEHKWNTALRLSDGDRLELVEPWRPVTVIFDDDSIL